MAESRRSQVYCWRHAVGRHLLRLLHIDFLFAGLGAAVEFPGADATHSCCAAERSLGQIPDKRSPTVLLYYSMILAIAFTATRVGRGL